MRKKYTSRHPIRVIDYIGLPPSNNPPEIQAPKIPLELVKDTRSDAKEILELPNEEFDGKGCA